MFDKIKEQFEENPGATVAVGALALTAVTGFFRTLVAANNSRTWSKEVKRRNRMSK